MSGSARISLGSPLPLVLEVFDGSTGVFPRANVYDSSFTEVSGSPFVLTHVANGLYKNTAFTPLSAGLYYAVFTVYSDSGHTTEAKKYSRETDEFDVNTLLADTVGLNAKIGTPSTGTVVGDIAGVNDNIDSDEGRTA